MTQLRGEFLTDAKVPQIWCRTPYSNLDYVGYTTATQIRQLNSELRMTECFFTEKLHRQSLKNGETRL